MPTSFSTIYQLCTQANDALKKSKKKDQIRVLHVGSLATIKKLIGGDPDHYILLQRGIPPNQAEVFLKGFISGVEMG